ncbi:MAG: hypothetical protein AB7O38_11640, partial [Pirellulaceae bacterium]
MACEVFGWAQGKDISAAAGSSVARRQTRFRIDSNGIAPSEHCGAAGPKMLGRELILGYRLDRMQGEVISIGEELTSGERRDTNCQWISVRLGVLGIRVG